MKFRLKITLSMLCLMALSFGVGGSLLIALSFDSSLERQEASARESHQLILDAMGAIGALDAWTSSSDVSSLLDKLHADSASSWSALRLSSDERLIHESGDTDAIFVDDRSGIDQEHGAAFALSGADGRRYLQLTGAVAIDGERCYLDALHDITPLYEARDHQLAVFRIVFLVLMACCALCAYGIAWLLTRPLSKLSRAACELASGNLAYRSNVSANDEIGALSADFDVMAMRVERSVAGMQQALERQERFMGSFAHELKTPMTSIIGYADLLRRNTLEPHERREAAAYVFSEGKRLENLSLRLLDLFVLGNSEPVLAPQQPAALVEDACAHEKQRFDRQRAQLIARCEEGTCLLETDLVHSLLLNLIENARKALEGEGTVLVSCTMLPDGCRIVVEDDGRGIPRESLAHVAEAFYRVDTVRSRAEGGAGLGLSFCSKIADVHHGSLRIESEEGRGTRVTVCLRGGRP